MIIINYDIIQKYKNEFLTLSDGEASFWRLASLGQVLDSEDWGEIGLLSLHVDAGVLLVAVVEAGFTTGLAFVTWFIEDDILPLVLLLLLLRWRE